MAYKQFTALNQRDLFRQIRNFTCGYRENDPYVYSASGSKDNELQYFGAKHQDGVATNETWTLTCTTPGGDGVGIFSVSGSVSGALADATVGRYYDTPQVCFIIERNSYDFAAAETFVITTTGNGAAYTSGEKWTLMQETIVDNALYNDNYIQMQGPGLTDDRTINIICFTKASPSQNIYGIGYLYATSYAPGDYPSQPGAITDATYQYTSDGEMDCWIFVNKQRFIVLNRSAIGVYHSAYAGYFYPYGTPGQYAFPCMVSSNCDNIGHPYTSTSIEVRSIIDPADGAVKWKTPRDSNEEARHFSNEASGGLQVTSANGIWPYGARYSIYFWRALRESEDGTRPMLPCVFMEYSPEQVLGEMDGVCAVPGWGLNPEDIIQDSQANDHVVWRHPTDPSPSGFFAVRLA